MASGASQFKPIWLGHIIAVRAEGGYSGDLVHCPPQTKHIILGTGDEPCVVLAIGAREQHDDVEWGG